MAYGLPVKGQANYDDELNNSIESVRSDAALAKSTADAANTSANTAKTDATSAKATANQALDFVRTTSDARVAEHINDPASSTRTALSDAYVDRLDDEAAHYRDLAACLDPRACHLYMGTGLNVTVPTGRTWYSIGMWREGQDAIGYTYHRHADPNQPLALPAGTNLKTDAAAPAGYFYVIKPELVTEVRTDSCGLTSGSTTVTDSSITVNDYGKPVAGAGVPAGAHITNITTGVSFTMSAAATLTGTKSLTIGDTRYATDPRGLYFSRLAQLRTIVPTRIVNKVVAGSTPGTSVQQNFAGPGDFWLGIITQVSAHDVSWSTIDGDVGPINLDNEISDYHQIRVAESVMIPFRRNQGGGASDPSGFNAFATRAANASGNNSDLSLGGWGAVRYCKLPVGW